MVKIDIDLINEASYALEGGLNWFRSEDRPRIQRFLKKAGITRGQWKRYLKNFKSLSGSDLTRRKLEIIAQYANNPHLDTLLKMAEAQEVDDDQ